MKKACTSPGQNVNNSPMPLSVDAIMNLGPGVRKSLYCTVQPAGRLADRRLGLYWRCGFCCADLALILAVIANANLQAAARNGRPTTAFCN